MTFGGGTFDYSVVFNHLPEIMRRFPDVIADLIAAQANESRDEVKQNIIRYDAIDTGALYNSVAVEEVTQTSAVVHVRKSYGTYVDVGTRFMPSRPFFYSEVIRSQVVFPQRMKQLEAKLR